MFVKGDVSENLKNIPTMLLATFIGVTPAFVSNIKAGRRQLPGKYCLAISLRFGIALYDLRADLYPEDVSGYPGYNSI